MSTAISASFHGDCYPSTQPEALRYFRRGLDGVPDQRVTDSLFGIVAPHIDPRVSLKAHATAFKPLADQLASDPLYLILGVGHHSKREWNLDTRDYLTPLGRAVCAREMVGQLPRWTAPAGHEKEHSIEFPIVWLQALHLLAEDERPVQFVPLLCGGLHDYVSGGAAWDDLDEFHELSGALAKLIPQHPNLRVIVSIDGCHLGPRFKHNFAVTPELLRGTERWENELWSRVAQGDARAFLDWMREEGNHRYFDGVGALALHLASGAFRIERTYYEQWFTPQDASAVTFSSGLVQRCVPATRLRSPG